MTSRGLSAIYNGGLASGAGRMHTKQMGSGWLGDLVSQGASFVKNNPGILKNVGEVGKAAVGVTGQIREAVNNRKQGSGRKRTGAGRRRRR